MHRQHSSVFLCKPPGRSAFTPLMQAGALDHCVVPGQVPLVSSTITPSALVRNLGVIFDDQLTFKEHIAKTARSCRFTLHNIRKTRPFLTEHAAQLLVQGLVISRLDYCNALLAGLPSNTIKPESNDSECSSTTGLQWAQKSPCYISLFLLALATSCSSHPVQDTDACI